MGRKAILPPGEAKEDWWITNEIGKRLGLKWEYKHPKDIFIEMAKAMPSLNNITFEYLHLLQDNYGVLFDKHLVVLQIK